MNGEQYKNLSAFFSETKPRSTTIKTLHDILPALLYVFYPLQALFLGFTEGWLSEIFLRFTIVPFATLVVTTVVRAIINAKRPYEAYDYTPVVRKQTKGKSFPSRHTVSAFIIAMAFLYIQTKLGVVMLVIAAMIGVTRVLSGVHFIRDVVGGAVIGTLIGVIFFFLI